MTDALKMLCKEDALIPGYKLVDNQTVKKFKQCVKTLGLSESRMYSYIAYSVRIMCAHVYGGSILPRPSYCVCNGENERIL